MMSSLWSYLTTTNISSTSPIVGYGMLVSGLLTVIFWLSGWWQRWVGTRYKVVLTAILPVVTVSAPLVTLVLFLRFEAIPVFTMRIWFYSILVISFIMMAWRLRPVKKQLIEQGKEDDRYIHYDRYLPRARRR